MPNFYPGHYPPKGAQESDLGTFFWRLSKNENLSEMKQPLETCFTTL